MTDPRSLRLWNAMVEGHCLDGGRSARGASSAEIARRFPKAARGPLALRAFAHWLAFYGGFFAYARGLVPAWAFVGLGLPLFVRYFDLTHEEMHARDDGARAWSALRLVFSVSGPLQLGYAQLARWHRMHHAHDGGARDPDRWISRAPLPVAVVACLTQPEQAVIRYVAAYGVGPRLAFDLALHLGAWVAMGWACTPTQFLVYNAVVRTGNGLSWLVFTYGLHHPRLYRSFRGLPLPRWLRFAWLVIVGRNNLNAVTYHFLHHAYGSVPSRDLPALSDYVVARTTRARGSTSA